MRRRSVAVWALCVCLASGAAVAGVLGVAPSAGATGTVPGPPTNVKALAGREGQATVSFQEPAANAGSPIMHNTATATDVTNPARGGQQATGVGVPYGNADTITVKHLAPGDSYTFTVTATDSTGTGPASSPSNEIVVNGPPPPAGITCKLVNGSSAGEVTVSNCRSGSKTAVGGTLPGSTFVGSATGMISWSSSTSTTVSITTSLSSANGYCTRQGYQDTGYVTGTVTSNTNPDVVVGDSVSGTLCISSAGTIRQDHYSHFSV